jgi:hypothetical protein
MKKKPQISALNEIVSAIFHDSPTHGRKDLFMIHTLWHKAVGGKIAENTLPQTIRKNILFVTVSNSVWMQELQFLKDQIRERINKDLPTLTIDDIRFKIGPVKETHRTSSKAPLLPLDPEEKQYVKKHGAAIKDPDLRSAFEAVMESYLRNKKKIES